MAMDLIRLSIKSIDALARGLQVMKMLEHERSMSIQELGRTTGIARATLLRVLKTLAEASLVVRNPLNGRYICVPPGNENTDTIGLGSQLSELTLPARKSLEKQIPWPTNLAIRDQVDMLILNTQSSCSLTPNYHALGYRPPLLVSAAGKAYLAWSDPNTRQQAISLALQSGRLRKDIDPAALERELTKIRRQGYAIDNSEHVAANSPANYGALAVPVMAGSVCVASLAVVWIPAIMGQQEVIDRYASKLQQAATIMSRTLTDARFRMTSVD